MLFSQQQAMGYQRYQIPSEQEEQGIQIKGQGGSKGGAETAICEIQGGVGTATGGSWS